jgi:hypothetical protein
MGMTGLPDRKPDENICKRVGCSYYAKRDYNASNTCDYRVVEGKGRGMPVKGCTHYTDAPVNKRKDIIAGSMQKHAKNKNKGERKVETANTGTNKALTVPAKSAVPPKPTDTAVTKNRPVPEDQATEVPASETAAVDPDAPSQKAAVHPNYEERNRPSLSAERMNLNIALRRVREVLPYIDYDSREAKKVHALCLVGEIVAEMEIGIASRMP